MYAIPLTKSLLEKLKKRKLEFPEQKATIVLKATAIDKVITVAYIQRCPMYEPLLILPDK
jgi:hypothetical protein